MVRFILAVLIGAVGVMTFPQIADQGRDVVVKGATRVGATLRPGMDPAVVVLERVDAALNEAVQGFSRFRENLASAGGLDRLSGDALEVVRKELLRIARMAKGSADGLLVSEDVIRKRIREAAQDTDGEIAKRQGLAKTAAEKAERLPSLTELPEDQRRAFATVYETLGEELRHQASGFGQKRVTLETIEAGANQAFALARVCAEALGLAIKVVEGTDYAPEELKRLEALVERLQEVSVGIGRTARDLAELIRTSGP